MNTLYATVRPKQLPVDQCRYCGGRDFTVGYQHDQGMVTFRKFGIFGSNVKLLICKQCGIIQCSKVGQPWKFPSAEVEW